MNSLAELSVIIDYLIPKLASCPVVTFTGDLGAGKTTLIKEICRRLNVVDEVVSPTFSIINTYMTKNQQPVHHVDLYRLESAEDLVQIGIDDYLQSGELTFIEWPQKIESFLPENTLRLSLEHIDMDTRKIVIL